MTLRMGLEVDLVYVSVGEICRQTGLELCRSKVWWSWECDGQTGLSLRGKDGHAALSKVPVPSDNKSLKGQD